jgi:hypothetical protein
MMQLVTTIYTESAILQVTIITTTMDEQELVEGQKFAHRL